MRHNPLRRCRCLARTLPKEALTPGTIITTSKARIIRTFDTDTTWSHVGAVWTPGEVQDYTGLDGYALQLAPMLRLTARNGQVVYPAYQFEHGHVADGVEQIVSILPATLVNPWTVAAWLAAPSYTLAWASPIELMRAGRGEEAIQAAQAWAKRLEDEQKTDGEPASA